jgi:hypothetical protein
MHHIINSGRDTRSNIDASCDHYHESELRRREEYDWNHDEPARSRAARTDST